MVPHKELLLQHFQTLGSRLVNSYIKELKENAEQQLKYNYLNKHREDISDFLRGKIATFEELLVVPDVLKRSTNAREAVLGLHKASTGIQDVEKQVDEFKVRL